MTFNFKRASQFVDYTIQKSEDLVSWSDMITVGESHGSIGDDIEVDVPAQEMASGKLFLRLKIED